MKKKNIKLMTDYLCWPIWDMDDPGNINPSDLDLTEDLRNQLADWQFKYDSNLIDGYPHAKDFDSAEDLRAFERQGHDIHKQMVDEIGNKYNVFIFSDVDAKLHMLDGKIYDRPIPDGM